MIRHESQTRRILKKKRVESEDSPGDAKGTRHAIGRVKP